MSAHWNDSQPIYWQLIASERSKFLNDEWPAMLCRIEQLGLEVEDLPRETPNKESSDG